MQIDALRAVFVDSGAIEHGKKTLKGHLTAASRLIQKLPGDQEYIAHLLQIVDMLEL